MARPALTLEQITEVLDIYFDVEFSFIKTEEAAGLIVTLPRSDQDFIINLTQRIAATNSELAFQFAKNALTALHAMDRHMVEAWAMTATDSYDRKGLFPAMTVIRELDSYVHTAHTNACGAVLEEELAVLLPFLQGLSGRKLKIAEAADNLAYTDSETIYLPAITALLEDAKDNFLIYKASVAFLWAQIHFGTFRINFDDVLDCDNPEVQLEKLSLLETIRLEACLKRELPGLHRDMQLLKNKTGTAVTKDLSENWQQIHHTLSSKHASSEDSLNCLSLIDESDCTTVCCYQGTLKLDLVEQVKQKRIEKEKAYFRIALSELAKESLQKNSQSSEDDMEETLIDKNTKFEIRNNDEQRSSGIIELELEGELVAVPEHIQELMTSIVIDFGEIPPEHLHAAGPGEYDMKKYEDEILNPKDVWNGTYPITKKAQKYIMSGISSASIIIKTGACCANWKSNQNTMTLSATRWKNTKVC